MVADEYDVRKYIQFKHTVSKLQWDESRRLWSVECSNGKKFYAKFVIDAKGILSDIKLPDIAGQKSFKGDSFHSGQWDSSVKLHNKRVAVIGSGASSIQLVPELQKLVSKLSVFQRSAGWVVRREDKAVRKWLRWLYFFIPLSQRFIRGCMYWFREGLVLAFKYNFPLRQLMQALAYANLYIYVPDKELREKLTPNFQFGCKRVLFSDDWYRCMQKANVELITDSIDHIESDGIVTKDGKKHIVDVIVYATGYAIQRGHHKEVGFPVIGKDGMALSDLWEDHMFAYKSSAVPHFPNLFWMLGKHTVIVM
jgi:cation diffusion facilitator CzcD-associated flavoprotein CzcO